MKICVSVSWNLAVVIGCRNRLDSVRQIWDFILENQKLKPIWENILIYKNAFNFTPKLISFMVSASTELGKANTENVPHSFIQDFIKANDNKAFPILIPHLRLDPFDVPLSQIAEENVSILIDYRHIPFTPGSNERTKETISVFTSKVYFPKRSRCICGVGFRCNGSESFPRTFVRSAP